MNRSRDSIDTLRPTAMTVSGREPARGVWLIVLLVALCARMATAQTITNGAETAGTLLANTTNSYTFNATNGGGLTLRMGATTFNPRIVLFNPSGVAIGSA